MWRAAEELSIELERVVLRARLLVRVRVRARARRKARVRVRVRVRGTARCTVRLSGRGRGSRSCAPRHLRVEAIRVGGVQVLLVVLALPPVLIGRRRRRGRRRGRLWRGGRLRYGTVVVVARGCAVRAHVGLGSASATLASVDEPRAVRRDVLELSRCEDGARGAARGRGLVLPMLVDARAAAAGIASMPGRRHYLLSTQYSVLTAPSTHYRLPTTHDSRRHDSRLLPACPLTCQRRRSRAAEGSRHSAPPS